jgi:hypothetical protein
MSECQTAKEIKAKIKEAKTNGERAKLKGLLEAHKRQCPICGPKKRETFYNTLGDV